MIHSIRILSKSPRIGSDTMIDKRKFNVLSLCGGGVRGLISASILKDIEQRLMKKLSTFDVRLADFYDLIAGTSAGGFLTSLLLAPEL